MLTFTRFTVDAKRRLFADGKPLAKPLRFDASEQRIGITRRGLAIHLFTSPEPDGGEFEWIDIGDKPFCVIVRYRGDIEIEEVEARMRAVLPEWIAIEVTRDRQPNLSITLDGVDVTAAASKCEYATFRKL